jgi:DNA replication and repair protein RecF
MNAQGKTNLIEAIYYLSTGKSYRPARDSQLINYNNCFFTLTGKLLNNYRSMDIEISYNSKRIPAKEVKINGVKKHRYSELFGNLTTVLFAPEDLNIIKGTPGDRRKFIDNDIMQIKPSYFVLLQKYSRILIQRNYLLKMISENKRAVDELDIWDHQFFEVSGEIIEKRIETLEKIAPLASDMQKKLTNGRETLEIKYLLDKDVEIKKKDDVAGSLKAKKEKRRKDEIKKSVTMWGPHLDDISLSLNGSDLKLFGSQGQHRTAVLALKLAEVEFLKDETGEYPVFLLDDVLSELDSYRRKQLIASIQEKEIQCFITTAEEKLLNEFDKLNIKKFIVHQGQFHITGGT